MTARYFAMVLLATTFTVGAEEVPASSSTNRADHVVCIDAGHQAKADPAQEPIGPGSTQMKMRVAGGTRGTATGIPEYELNLAIAKLLAADLRKAGIGVVMVRETDDVNISNAERARMANDCGADIYVRIHADANDNPSLRGAHTSCMTAANPWNGALYDKSRSLCELVLSHYCSASGLSSRGVHPRDDLTGTNWCKVPVCLIELGFMTNPDDDRLLNNPTTREKMAQGLCDGILAYFAK